MLNTECIQNSEGGNNAQEREDYYLILDLCQGGKVIYSTKP